MTFLPKKGTGFMAKNLSSDLGKKISAGIFWTFFSTIVFRGLIFFTSIFVARLLKREGFGELGIIRSTIDMFVSFAGFGLGLTTTKFVAQYKQSDKVKTGRIIHLSSALSWIFGGLIGGILFFFADYLAVQSLNAPYLAGDLKIGAFALLFYSINGAQNGTLSGFEAFKNIARMNMISGVINFFVSVALVYYMGVKGAVLGLGLNALVISVLGAWEVRKVAKKHSININQPGAWAEYKVLTGFSLPAVLSNSLVMPVTWICNAMLVKEPGGFRDMGIYNAGLSILILVNVVNSMLGQVLLPYAVQNFSTRNKKFEALNNVMPWAIGIFISMPFMFIPEIGELLFGKEFAGPSLKASIVIIMISTIIISHRQGIARNFAAGSLMWWGVLGNAFWGLAALITMYMVKETGAIGRSAAFCIAYVLNTIVFIPFYLKKKLCDRDYIASLESNAIWGIIIGSFAWLYWMGDHGLLQRIGGMIVALAGISVLLFRYFKKYVA